MSKSRMGVASFKYFLFGTKTSEDTMTEHEEGASIDQARESVIVSCAVTTAGREEKTSLIHICENAQAIVSLKVITATKHHFNSVCLNATLIHSFTTRITVYSTSTPPYACVPDAVFDRDHISHANHHHHLA